MSNQPPSQPWPRDPNQPASQPWPPRVSQPKPGQPPDHLPPSRPHPIDMSQQYPPGHPWHDLNPSQVSPRQNSEPWLDPLSTPTQLTPSSPYRPSAQQEWGSESLYAPPPPEDARRSEPEPRRSRQTMLGIIAVVLVAVFALGTIALLHGHAPTSSALANTSYPTPLSGGVTTGPTTPGASTPTTGGGAQTTPLPGTTPAPGTTPKPGSTPVQGTTPVPGASATPSATATVMTAATATAPTATATSAPTATPLPPVEVADTDASFAYQGSWSTYSPCSGCYGGSDQYSNDPSGDVTFTFTGTRVQIIIDPNYNVGIYGVSLDGGSMIHENGYSSTLMTQHVIYDSGTLHRGTHTVTMSVTGLNGSGVQDSGNDYIDVDAAIYWP